MVPETLLVVIPKHGGVWPKEQQQKQQQKQNLLQPCEGEPKSLSWTLRPFTAQYPISSQFSSSFSLLNFMGSLAIHQTATALPPLGTFL